MVKTIQTIEDLFGLDYKDIDRYVDMVNIGLNQKDNNLIIKYGKKLYDLQNRIHSYAQSPFIEFALYQAYISKQMYHQALQVIEALLKNVTLTLEDKSRAKYLEGTVLEKLWRDTQAKEAYKEAIKADKNSAWAKLAQSALEISKN
jgi:predicted RNA polymerase sigma factor